MAFRELLPSAVVLGPKSSNTKFVEIRSRSLSITHSFSIITHTNIVLSDISLKLDSLDHIFVADSIGLS